MEETLEKQIRDEVITYYRGTIGRIGSNEYFNWLADYVLGETNCAQLFQWLTEFKFINENTKILDIGCSFGSILCYLKSKGISSFGIEPDTFRRDIAQKRIDATGNQDVKTTIHTGVGENLPFKDNSFDIVILKEILEHVSNPQQVLDEGFRVLNPSGLMYISAPNYIWMFKEPHYSVPWMPLFPKSIAKLYLKFIGKYTPYFDSINQITSYTILKNLKRNNSSILYPVFLYPKEKIESPSLIKTRWQRYIIYLIKSVGLGFLLKLLLKIRFLLRSFVFNRSTVVLVSKNIRRG